MKITGSSRAEFDHDGSVHAVELSWGVCYHQCFPYQLWIDGAKVAVSDVSIENAELLVIPLLILTSPILLALLGSLF
jgi:hypothetical protein